jgi:hypothetical protein
MGLQDAINCMNDRCGRDVSMLGEAGLEGLEQLEKLHSAIEASGGMEYLMLLMELGYGAALLAALGLSAEAVADIAAAIAAGVALGVLIDAATTCAPKLTAA